MKVGKYDYYIVGNDMKQPNCNPSFSSGGMEDICPPVRGSAPPEKNGKISHFRQIFGPLPPRKRMLPPQEPPPHTHTHTKIMLLPLSFRYICMYVIASRQEKTRI